MTTRRARSTSSALLAPSLAVGSRPADAPEVPEDDRAPVVVAEDALLARTRPARDALLATAVLRPNLDVARIAGTVLASLGDLAALRPRMALLPDVDVQKIDRLEELASVVACLEDRVRRARRAGSKGRRQALLDEGWALLRKLKRVAEALVGLEVFSKAELAASKLGRTREALPDALAGLCALYRRYWRKIDGHTPVTDGDLARAYHVAALLPGAAAVEDPSAGALRALADQRDRAYTLLLDAWDEARRAVVFLRWREKDADRFAPSLFAGRVDPAKAKAARAKKRAATAAVKAAAPGARAATAEEEAAAPGEVESSSKGLPAAPHEVEVSAKEQPAARREASSRAPRRPAAPRKIRRSAGGQPAAALDVEGRGEAQPGAALQCRADEEGPPTA